MRYVVIMAGGSGTRLWPLSRQGMPKQFLHLVEGKSLLLLAYERVAGLVPDENILICTGAAYLDVVAGELPELPRENLLGEPVGRDSLNAVAWPCAVLAQRDPDAVTAFVSADQIIEPVSTFQQTLAQAYDVAQADPLALVTLGVIPTSAHTGMGYLHRGEEIAGFDGCCAVREFREKPDAQTAQSYLASGEYWWNSGMFVWHARTLLDQLEVLLPHTYAAVIELANHPERVGDIYPTLEKTSIDFGVMEPVSQGRASAHVVACPLPTSFHDVGGYAALAQQLTHDEHGNAVEGMVAMLDGSGNLILNRTPGHLVATSGLTDMIVVHTEDITLVCPMSDAQRVKDLVAHAGSIAGPEFK
ncbi:MAG: mannose-1-phosphate guanylyltransferase [Propionibacteriaceae bacterium]